MARPKKSDQDSLQRIENAFWAMLEQEDYSELTIKTLALNAGVNHNTVYYYFKNMDAIAESLFQKEYEDSVSQVTFNLFINGNITVLDLLNDNDVLKRLHRIKLFAGSKAPFLRNIFITHIKAGWLNHMGLQEDCLSKNEQMDLNFILNGIASVIGSIDVSNSDCLVSFFERSLGKGIRETFKQILNKHKN